ncbi:hypothetical protein [Pseudomonas putida]|uniref:hypothetical protein n=1 Tax=Pseudomonas putida TaxID=303 RepID=UPI002B24FFE7|nr:hypothetical protein [Pseudomonas putida]
MKRILGLMMCCTITLGLLWCGLAFVERIYWVNSSTYTSLLSRDVTITEDIGRSEEGYGALCPGTRSTLEEKDNGHFVRCGCGFIWTPGSVYRINNYEQLSAWMWQEGSLDN